MRRSSSSVGRGRGRREGALLDPQDRLGDAGGRAVRRGVEACPPRPSATSSTLVVPFSVTPMTPERRLDARERLVRDRAALVEHEPRRDAASRAAPRPPAIAAVPLTSSSQPKDSHTSWAGVTPSSSSSSTASQIATTQPLSSRVPRPQIAAPVGESAISAPNGGCCHGALSSIGTTSRWAISTTGRSALRPATGRAGRGCRRASARARRGAVGTASASSSRSRSKAAVSTSAGSRSDTVGMRTRAWSLATTRSVGAAMRRNLAVRRPPATLGPESRDDSGRIAAAVDDVRASLTSRRRAR